MWKEITLKSDDKVEDDMLVTRWQQDEQAVAVRWFCLLVSFGLFASSQLPNITSANVYLTKTWYLLNLALRVVSGRFFPIRVVNKSKQFVCLAIKLSLLRLALHGHLQTPRGSS